MCGVQLFLNINNILHNQIVQCNLLIYITIVRKIIAFRHQETEVAIFKHVKHAKNQSAS